MIVFSYYFSVNQKRLNRLIKHDTSEGLSPPEKKSGGRKNTRKIALSYEDIRKVVSFLVNYAEEHALHLPGRVPGYRKDDITLLPSSHTKISVYNVYRNAFGRGGMELFGSQKHCIHYLYSQMNV